MRTRVPPDEDLALDPAAVLGLLGLDRQAVVVTVLQHKEKRLVVRYGLEDGTAVVGKWYSTDRGALVNEALAQLRRRGIAVPAPVASIPEHRVLFVEAVDGATLRDVLGADPGAARAAGAWLARFHASGFESPRDCGPAKMIASIRRWSERSPELAGAGARLLAILDREANPRRPVHFDYYHAQVLLPPGGEATVVDLDEAGLGDPAFDVAHFIAHLRRLGIRQAGDPAAYEASEAAFLDGYASHAPVPDVRRAHIGFAWFKLAFQAIARGQPGVAAYAIAQLERRD